MTEPYGFRRIYSEPMGEPYCINSEPGTFNHECQKPALWVGTNSNGFAACYCDDCKQNGYEAAGIKDWRKV